jgi:hypothetical protein
VLLGRFEEGALLGLLEDSPLEPSVGDEVGDWSGRRGREDVTKTVGDGEA